MKYIWISGGVVLVLLAVPFTYVGYNVCFDSPTRVQYRYIADFSDMRNVLAVSEQAAVVRIVAFEKQIDDDLVPELLYRAEVLESIKGDMSGEVFLLQQDIAYCKTLFGINIVSEESYLENGAIYVIAAKEDVALSKKEGREIQAMGSHENFTRKLDKDFLVDNVEQHPIVIEWQQAYENENVELRQQTVEIMRQWREEMSSE